MRPTSIFLILVLIAANARLGAEDASHEEHEHHHASNLLFNGNDLDGWSGDPRLWSIRDGVIHGETTAENVAKGNTFLIWQGGKVKDFELRMKYRCNATNNSGVQYRSKHITDKSAANEWVVRGYQHEIRNENQFPDVSGFIYEEGGERGRICVVGEKAEWNEAGKKVLQSDLIDQTAFQRLMRLDDWNEIKIVARGHHIQHYVNDKLIVDFTDNHPTLTLLEGVLALQLHAGAPMWAEYKDIQLKAFDARHEHGHHHADDEHDDVDHDKDHDKDGHEHDDEHER